MIIRDSKVTGILKWDAEAYAWEIDGLPINSLPSVLFGVDEYDARENNVTAAVIITAKYELPNVRE